MSSFRVAQAADRSAVTATICSSFDRDPVWSWVFSDDDLRPAQYALWWGAFVRSGVLHPWVRVTDRCESVALWIPPSTHELTAEDEEDLDRQLDALPGDGGARARTMLSRFEAARPEDPHHYLSIFGTHTDFRGRGLGMALLADNLAEIDALHSPAYLESTNPANLDRYASVGFEPRDELRAPNGLVVTTMWRSPR